MKKYTHQFLVTVISNSSSMVLANTIAQDIGSWKGSLPQEERIEIESVEVQEIRKSRFIKHQAKRRKEKN